jgi:hypothetical protein
MRLCCRLKPTFAAVQIKIFEQILKHRLSFRSDVTQKHLSKPAVYFNAETRRLEPKQQPNLINVSRRRMYYFVNGPPQSCAVSPPLPPGCAPDLTNRYVATGRFKWERVSKALRVQVWGGALWSDYRSLTVLRV